MLLKTLLYSTALAVLGVVHTSTAQTNGLTGQTNLYPVFFKGVCVSTNESGLVYDWVGNRDVIEDCATEHGITNLSGLHLVYNYTNDSLQVVGATNQVDPTNVTTLCTVLSFEDGLSLPDTNYTVIERLAFVYVGTNTMASGTLSAKERYTYGTNDEVTAYHLIGQLNYTEPALGTNSPAICRATLVVGFGDFKPHDDDDDDDHGGKGHDKEKPGNNGKHLGQIKNGNNGKHLGQNNNDNNGNKGSRR